MENLLSWRRPAVLCALLALATSFSVLGGEDAELEQLKATLAAMEKTMRELKERVQELEARQATQAPAVPNAPTNASPAVSPKGLPEERRPSEDLADRTSPMRHRETVLEDNVAAPRPGNAPLDPTYAGFMPLFGTKTWIKLGGYAKVDAIVDTTKVGNPNKFVTASIPVAGEANFGTDEEFTLHAKQTRLNFELRSPTSLGSLRVVYENDFYGNAASPDMDYNLRHFYGQLANLTVGQTWTAFFDPDAGPDTLDMAGPGMQTVLRQPQIRYTFSPGHEHMHVSVGVEQPKSDVVNLPAGATARNIMPDVAANWRWEGKPGHVQLGGLVRGLSYDQAAGPEDTEVGWGLNLSGVLHTWGQDNVVARVTYGEGVGRYLQDLSGSNGAVVDAAGALHTLPAWGAMLGYRHFWTDHWRSEVSYGYLELDSRPEQGPKAYDHTHYAQANLVWAATAHFYVGMEYLYGRKEARDRTDGEDHRVQLSLQYKLIR